MPLRPHHLPALALALALALSACGGGSSHPDIADILGPSTATGTIVATGSSLHRRGTHLLTMNGRNRFFLESRSVHLNDYIDQYVSVEGEIAPNTYSSFLPVMQVVSVVPIEGGATPDVQRYDVASLRLTLEAPRLWQSSLDHGRLTFQYTEEDQPFIAVEHDETGVLPQEGIPIRIDGRNGVRIVDEETGVHRAYVKLSDDMIILFTFGPKGPGSMGLRDAFYTMLQSVEFPEEVEEGVEVEEGTEVKGSGQPCGGSAGVLCPEGEYCAVTEFATGIGQCREL